ncbi:MAG: transcriptional regulator, TetR family [Caulobacter sp.]|nr:transcriptional regulator, TetR family [Caulobacter sp.]
MSQREDAKAERRRRIVAAARALIRETGDAGLSMRAIAARAGVSLTTPYNLFGSKRAIVVAVLEDVRQFQDRFAELQQLDVIDRIFQAVSISMTYYAQDEAFYRPLWTEALDTNGKELRTTLSSERRYAFWRGLVDEAAAAGAVLPGLDADLLVRSLERVFGSAMLSWVLGAIPTSNLEATAGLGYALALRGATVPERHPAIEARLMGYQRELLRLPKAAPAA